MQPILVRPGRGRPFRDHRRRAPLARRAAGGPARGAGAREEHSRPIGARTVAHREHPARGPQRDRGGAGAAAPDRRIQAHARRRRQGDRPLAQHRDQPAAAHHAREAGAGLPVRGCAGDGPCARAARALSGPAGRRRCARCRRRLVGARHRAARASAAERGEARGAHRCARRLRRRHGAPGERAGRAPRCTRAHRARTQGCGARRDPLFDRSRSSTASSRASARRRRSARHPREGGDKRR